MSPFGLTMSFLFHRLAHEFQTRADQLECSGPSGDPGWQPTKAEQAGGFEGDRGLGNASKAISPMTLRNKREQGLHHLISYCLRHVGIRH
jgi:hypothetical protein